MKEAEMKAEDFVDRQCPHCKNGFLKEMISNALTCYDCGSTFILTGFTDDKNREIRIVTAQRKNPEFSKRMEQLRDEGKTDLEIDRILEKEHITYYSIPPYKLEIKLPTPT